MTAAPAAQLPTRIVDADTHLTEPWDLWTSRAPRSYEQRLPHVEDMDGTPHWVLDGVDLGPALAGGVVRSDGSKVRRVGEFFRFPVDEAHPGGSRVAPRLELMDEQGIWAHIVYPNTVGFGGQRFMSCEDSEVRLQAIKIYNDAMADLQAESGQRLFPMGVLPWWDLERSTEEAGRCAELGLRGVTMCPDPQDYGLPDLGEPAWDPLWDTLSSAGLPLNFHIGASFTALSFYGSANWPSNSSAAKLSLGSVMLFLNNARVVGNLIVSGMLDRHPGLNVVSVESGIGWIPFFLEALDYQIKEMDPDSVRHLSLTPVEYFKRQIYSCFWFERDQLAQTIEDVGEDNCLFETDFPHSTCLYPEPVSQVSTALAGASAETVAKVLGGNAARLYRLPV
jgi:predicted TIM-barrel fold metal-dependent hydrolase